MESGIVVHEQNKYMLRVDNLETLVGEIRKDLDRTMTDLKQVAENIDKWLEL
jgi:hypothetical protein